MSGREAAMHRRALTGSRIRERRTALGLRQAELAERAGISPSYLNLIEHNKRRIGGKLLNRIAQHLGVEPAALSEGTDATLFDQLQTAAALAAGDGGPRPETDRIDALVSRFPGWAALIGAQQKRLDTLEGLVDGLRDRLAHDPELADAMHEVLSTAAAIRSTAEILVRERDLEAPWRDRFHRNLHEEAERLSARATAMIDHFEEAGGESTRGALGPQEAAEALFEAEGHHFPEIEAMGAAGIDAVLARVAEANDGQGILVPEAAEIVRSMLAAYASDAARLPLGPFAEAASAADYRPEALVAMAGGDVALVLRRLATLPGPGRLSARGEATPLALRRRPAPDVGLAICDASGALLYRRRINAFSIPRFGQGCPLWPLYRAFSRPLSPEYAVLEMPDGARFEAWAVAQPGVQATTDVVAQMPARMAAFGSGFAGGPVLQATMLIRPIDHAAPDRVERSAGGERGRAGMAAAGATAEPVGPGCQLCRREGCPTRRSRSVLA